MGENRKSGSENPVERRAANFLRKSAATNFFGQLPEEIARKRSLPRPGKFAGYGMYPKRDEENFAGSRSPSFLLLIEEKKQKKIKAPGVPAIFGRVRDG